MEADSTGIISESAPQIDVDSVSLPPDSDTSVNPVCDLSAGASQISTEMEEGELPSEDYSKPSTPIQIHNTSFNDDASSLASSQHAESGSTSLLRKPVLGKEKAKQRLKALRIQNKMQLESRLTSKKQLTKHSTEGGGSHLKKDRKFMYPHEKAQLTINEIEVMKLEGERPKAPIFYHESMIHRITVDSFDAGINSHLSQPPSIEALKAYNDEEFCEERKRKRAKPVAYRRRRRSTASPSRSKRRTKFKRDRSGSRESSRDRYKSGHRSTRRENRRSDERSLSYNTLTEEKGDNWRPSFAVRPGGGVPPMWVHGEHMRFTQTRPIISFSINKTSRVRKSKAKSKSRKKSKRKRELNISPNASIQEGDDVRLPNEKHKKKRRSKSKSRDHIASLTTKRKKKKKNKKSTQPKGQIGVLSFNVDDLNFEEELDGFPLSKEGFQPAADSDEVVDGQQTVDSSETLNATVASTPVGKLTIETPIPDENDFLFPPSIHESVPADKSPDTDDYMPNWEEEDEDSKDDMFANFLAKEPPSETNNDDAYSSAEDSTPESIKDGLGTPIFVNPSPPREIIELLSLPDFHDGQKSAADLLARRHTKELKESEEEESLTPPPVKQKHLFEMENIYEEFLRSVREDPDFKDNLPSKLSPKESYSSVGNADEESGFLSQSSISLTPMSTPGLLRSPPNSSSSDQSSKTDDTSDTESSETPSQSAIDPGLDNLSSKNSKRNAESNADAMNEHETTVENDEFANISSEDLKKLRSLQKRHGMLKWIRQQIDGMDEEDRVCLLGLEKLIRAERQLLLRNNAIKRLHNLKNILGTDSEDSNDGMDSNTSHNASSVAVNAPPQSAPDESSVLFDGKREAIKLTITSMSPMKKLPIALALQGHDANKAPSDEDLDFTERLMKPKEKPVSNQSRVDSQSPPRASKKRQSGRRGRSLSVSPMRRSRKSPSRERTNERSNRRAYSPSPSRTSSRRRDAKGSSRSRNSGSPPSSNRSRRFCRSPYHSSSSSPARSHSSSRSPSRSPLPAKEDIPADTRIVDSYPAWNIDRYSQYYVGESYYFPNTPSGANGAEHKPAEPHPRYPVSYHDYTQYNMYASEYMNMGPNYQGEFGQQQTDYSNHLRVASGDGSHDCNPYLSIPVIGSGSSAVGNSANYFYKDSGFENSHSSQMPMAANMQCLEIHRQEESNSPKPFAVQKGNVLEIVPATTITSVVRETTKTKEESSTSLDVVIKQEPADDDGTLSSEKVVDEDNQSEKKTECSGDIKVEVKTSKKSGHSWKDEVARRHVVSAVLRLNKETDDSPRGILKSRGNSTAPVRDKKKVLFADGIPPGRTSSASSDEEATLKFIKKRLKKTHRRMQSENKENEVSVEATDLAHAMLEAKADPELWDAPPPPPPPGSPPPHLPQPILIRPASPEELLYFHYDPVYNMMYVSPMENAIPPRLLQNNGKSVKPNVEVTSVENGENSSEMIASGGNKMVASPLPLQDNNNSSLNDKEESGDGIGSVQLASEKTIIPSPEQNDLQTSTSSPLQPLPGDPKCASPRPVPAPAGPPASFQQSSPPQQIQNISIRVSSNSPQLFNQSSLPPSSIPSSSSYEPPPPPSQSPSQQLHQSPVTRAPISIMVGYPGQIFNRMPNRRQSPNVLCSPYSMPPPPHNRAFNPHVPPPFHQPPPLASLNGPPHQVTFDGTRTPMPPSPVAHPPSPFNPNVIMFAGPQQQQQTPQQQPQQSQSSPLHSLRPQGYAFGVASSQTPPPHMMMNRPPNRFSSIPPPVPLPQFMHERNGSPRLGSHVFRHHHPPIMQPPPSQLQQQPSTPPPGTPYS